MQDAPNGFDTPMLGLPPQGWLDALEEIAQEHGTFARLGAHHVAALVEDQFSTLLVSFETLQQIQDRDDTGQPLGFELVRELGWSNLAMVSNGETWFRDPAIYDYFDHLIDEGFFDEFDRVLFYGAGSGGYAAAAFSVAAPGATVLAISPQATLDPRIAGWDTRYTHMRRVSFTDRYGYAPEMIEAAEHGFVLFNPNDTMQAMHAALFARANVTLLQTPYLGDDIEQALVEMQVLYRLLARAGAGRLDRASFAKLFRARRDYQPYLRRLLAMAERKEHYYLQAILCGHVINRMPAPKFQRKLDQLDRMASEGRLAG
ncbi:hypothetical protein SAMN04490248_11953 [Salinihabitans flavidus]|uniref:Phosphoadenosine phosphosulfate reductase n=1 Tax=Salinihabitans flavidus TaxID=569882 RepID=A0A1H8UCU7_9RHOB|nr:phosphoadenosine phosphosulfate reductase [Salinihabitans flavidus]SEP00926.1 hypothetical protein SAMN04490248_11953 [Salinihabitans flavidus]